MRILWLNDGYLQNRRERIRCGLSSLQQTKLDLDRSIKRLAHARKPLDDKPSSTAWDIASSVDGLIIDLFGLRALLSELPSLHRSVQGSSAPLLKATLRFVSSPRLESLSHDLQESLSDDLCVPNAPDRSFGATKRRNAQVFAIRRNHSPLLDVARATYKENLQDMYDMTQELVESLAVPLQLRFTGEQFRLEVDMSERQLMEQLPRNHPFVSVVRIKNGKSLSLSTIQLKKLNRRLADSYHEILLLVADTVAHLCSVVRNEVAALYHLSEAIALLDMLLAFAQVAASRPGYTRPSFARSLVIKAGRHPLLDAAYGQSIVANDVYNDLVTTFHLILGPSMSGKSTFLKQIGLLAIMASIGSFVPAEHATFQPMSAILTLISSGNSAEHTLLASVALLPSMDNDLADM